MENNKLTISVAEAAEMLGISRNLGYSLARQGKLSGVIKLGQKRMVVSRKVVDALLVANSEKEMNTTV